MIRHFDNTPNCKLTDTDIHEGHRLNPKVDLEQELRVIARAMERHDRSMITIARKAYMSGEYCQIRVWRNFPFSFAAHHVDSMGLEKSMIADITILRAHLEESHQAAIQKVIEMLQTILKDRYRSIDRIYKIEGMPVEFILCVP